MLFPEPTPLIFSHSSFVSVMLSLTVMKIRHRQFEVIIALFPLNLESSTKGMSKAALDKHIPFKYNIYNHDFCFNYNNEMVSSSS